MASYRFVLLVIKHNNDTKSKCNFYRQDSLISPKKDFINEVFRYKRNFGDGRNFGNRTKDTKYDIKI